MEDGAFTLVLLEESILKGFKRRGKECVGNRWPVYSDCFFFASFVSIIFKRIQFRKRENEGSGGLCCITYF